MADIISIMNTFFTNCTFCHDIAPPCISLFRFPLGYGNQRPFSATWTVTGSGACILSTSPPGEKAPLRSGKGCAAITGLTAGRVMDYGLRDSMNMGGCMAPAACDTIARSFSDFGRTPSDYDAVFTGDLGIIGQKILLDLLEEQNIRLSPIHIIKIKKKEACGGDTITVRFVFYYKSQSVPGASVTA